VFSSLDQTQVKDPLNTDLLLSSLVLSSNDAVNRRLKDSLAAKAANKLLNKWHSYSPLASLQELEEMYQKFYEYYYESNYGHADHNHHHLHHHDSHEFFKPHHHHHIHDLSHRHHHLNLLDFLESKSHKENDEEENKDQNLADRLLGSNLFSALNLNGLHAHHFSHHHHYDNIHSVWDHDHDHDYYKPISSYHYHDYIHHPHRHHHHHHHHHHHLSDHQSDHDHIDYIENYRYLKRNYLILKNKINYYQAQNMPVPWSLLHDYNRLSHMLDVYHEYPHRHHHHHHLHHLHHHNFGPYAPRVYGPDHYLYPYDELAHYNDDFNVHHLIPHIVPHYNNDIVKFFDKQMFLPQLPSIQNFNPPGNNIFIANFITYIYHFNFIIQ